MQQTSKYQFNLVDATDDFSPDPLNQNMEKVEEALEGLTENLGSIGHNLRVETGSYVGTGTYGQNNPMQLTFELYPVVVMIASTTNGRAMPPCFLMRPIPLSIYTAGGLGNQAMYVTWGDHEVNWYSLTDSYCHANEDGETYQYLVLGY